jgi:hypothetical protein
MAGVIPEQTDGLDRPISDLLDSPGLPGRTSREGLIESTETAQPGIEHWQPGRRVVILWTTSSAALTLAGVALFALIYTIPRGGVTVELAGLETVVAPLVFLAVLAVLLPLHERIHGLAMTRYGARPEYGAGVWYGFLPYLCCTAPGHKFTKRQFAVVSAAPGVVISLVGAFCVAFVPYGGWLVAPLGFHLGGCIGDLWFLGLVARQPRGTLLEDTRTGVRFHRPAARERVLDSPRHTS